MKGKKGIGILEVLSLWLYFIIVVFFMILLSIPSCLRPGTEESTITEEDDAAKIVKAQLEVSSALRTPLPDNFPDKLSWLDSKNFVGGVIFNWKQAETALRLNEELYKGKTYAEFISLLETSVPDANQRKNLFTAVTYFMFNRQIRDNIYEIVLPISVVYRKAETYYEDGDLSAVFYKDPPFVEIYIPLPDENIATVRVHYRQVSTS